MSRYRDSSDDEDDTFVTVGTPLPTYDAGQLSGIQSKRPIVKTSRSQNVPDSKRPQSKRPVLKQNVPVGQNVPGQNVPMLVT